MISVTEAKKIIRQNTTSLRLVILPLQNAAGLVLAEDIFSPINIPSFPQSSMDGYAFSFRSWKQNKELKIEGVASAGSNSNISFHPEHAIRIFTGAVVPDGADTVVMQEKTKTENGVLIVEDENLQEGMNVRLVGAELKSGSLALAKNSLLSPAAIGLLASIGIAEVIVYPKPSVCIIVTGDELQKPGNPLQYGQVYEANSYSLIAALRQQGIHHVELLYSKDTLKELTEVLRHALLQHDLIFLTGGISVGDFDFVLQATINNDVEKLFHRVKQKPAKPLYFGKKENKYVFGLPGNPASGLTAFYEYALIALSIMTNNHCESKILKVPLAKSFKKPIGLTHFLKGFYDGKMAMVLDGQESFRLTSFAKANCLIQIDEEITACKEGEFVEIHLLPE
ncbi:MAG TPA: gephyrin-like molybdotransferase Glp [Puia sp.]|nr:gephyrin-like molybdotransferase Glp [Puia sp.]